MIIIDTQQMALNARLKEIAGMELLAIDYAKNGKKFNHIEIEMHSLTQKFLKECVSGAKAPLAFRQKLSQPLSLSAESEKKDYKSVPFPAYKLFNEVLLNEVFYVKEFDNYTTRSLQGRLSSALNRYNMVTGNAHAYESHRTKNEIRFKRVG